MTDEERRLSRAYQRVYYRDHKEQCNAYARKYRVNNPERIKAINRRAFKKFYDANRDELNRKRRERYANNLSGERERSRSYYHEHRDEILEKQRIKRQMKKESLND